jgi:adenine-specific DNA-methyltransferase
MNKDAQLFLNQHSATTKDVDRLIVSAFLHAKELSPTDFLRQYYIKDKDVDQQAFKEFVGFAGIKDLEDVIEAFEFVISPKEKIVTGAVYTPVSIREFIVKRSLEGITSLKTVRLADISCGCAGFLITTARILRERTGRKYREIINENLWGLDIADYSITRSKIILSLLSLEAGDRTDLSFNLSVGNALDFSWADDKIIEQNGGFDVIVGNPPYVTSRNIDSESLKLLTNWEVTSTGHPDLYIPFFQIGLTMLKPGGILGYITVNTFFKSINGRALRDYFSQHGFPLDIIDFRGEQVFRKKNTYTCICFIKNVAGGAVRYQYTASKVLNRYSEKDYSSTAYDQLDHELGWHLGKQKVLTTVQKIERFKKKIFPTFSFSTGIATLKNSVYKFKPLRSERDIYILNDKSVEYRIEKAICRPIINPNKVTTEEDLPSLIEQIIFPYRWDTQEKKYVLLDERVFRREYPLAYAYLWVKRPILKKRDKGKAEQYYENWFAYGRNQGLHLEGIKLFIPHITKDPKFVISRNRKLLFCNGSAILSDNERSLLILKRILESRIFWFYVLKTSKPYSSDFFSLSKNYIKRFSIPEFTDTEEHFLLNEPSKGRVLTLLLKKYDINASEIDL